MKRKFLFVCFNDDECRLTHALWYAHELFQRGHEVLILLEGMATRCLSWLDQPGCEGFGKAFRTAHKAGILAGVCRAAASGCAAEGCSRNPLAIAQELGLHERDELSGHAGIGDWVDRGFEVTVF